MPYLAWLWQWLAEFQHASPADVFLLTIYILRKLNMQMKEAPPSDKSPLRLKLQLSWRLTAPEQWPVVSRTAKCGFAVKDLPSVSQELGVTNNVFSSIQSTSDRPHQATEGCYSHCWGNCYLWLRTLLWGHNCGMVPWGYKVGTKRQGKFKVYTGIRYAASASVFTTILTCGFRKCCLGRLFMFNWVCEYSLIVISSH